VALPHGIRAAREESGWSEAWQSLRRDVIFQQVLVSSLLIGLVFFQIGSTFGLYVTGIGFTARVYGAILSVNGGLVVLCELPLTTVTRRFPARRMMALGYLLIAAGFGLNSVARTVPALAACLAIFTVGEMMMMPVSAAYIADLCPPTMRGRYTG